MITASSRNFIRRGKLGPPAPYKQEASYRNQRYYRRRHCLEFIYQAPVDY